MAGQDRLFYSFNLDDHVPCALKPQCCPNTPQRKIARSIHEAARETARELVTTDASRQSRKDRKRIQVSKDGVRPPH